jgi:transcriptional regulator with XRE-family HTH domain
VTPTTDWNWLRLGQAVRARRRALRLSQAELGENAGVHEGTIRNLERGREAADLPRSTKDVERALGWAAGSFESVLEGGDPILLETASGIDPDKLLGAIEHARAGSPDEVLAGILAADLPAEVKHALLELHRTRVAEAQRQSREDLDRALRDRRA